jgi:uncharacterized protein (DUF302 family)
MTYYNTVVLDLSYDEAVPRVKDAFKEQGFGTLTEIDVRETLREKIGAEVEPYIILGACNPELAHRALEAEREIGVLLPCNVVVRATGDTTTVQALDPDIMVQLPGNPAIQDIADEASRRIAAALAALERG